MPEFIKNLLFACALLLSIAGTFVIPFLIVTIIDKLINKYRRKKYPDYFKLYDAAVTESFNVGAEFNSRYDHIKYKLKLWSDGLKDGECTTEHFEDNMAKLSREYQDLCCWYAIASTYIQDCWKLVDAHAKEHGLSWGIIYD